MSAGAPDSSGLSGAPPAPQSNPAISSGPSTPAPNSGFPRIEKFELLEEIGHGGMATVYRARDPRLGREVAVKVIHKHLRENPEVGTRFVAEARAAAKLRHPGIVEVFDVSSDDDPERYLVVELIRGTTLRKVLQKHRDMPAEIGAAIVLRICDALTHAHASSIIHRDIKPENVLVELPADRAAAAMANAPAPSTPRPAAIAAPEITEARPRLPAMDLGPSDTQASAADVVAPRGLRGANDGHKPRAEPRPAPPRPRDEAGVIIKITDFGIAKILDAVGVTSTGQVLGSPAHMAPEQIEGGEVDARTDVFALGVLMYECLVGHLPFEGKNPAQVLRRVLEGSYPAADRERPSVGGRWSRIVAHALAHEVAERTASAVELGDAIKAELEALSITDPRAEIEAYFADPEAHTADLVSRLVPRLVARGEAARRAGDVPGAAADWNRALALRPDDLAILKRIANLTSSAGRRQLLRRVGAIALGSAALGLVAFGAARAWKASTRGQALPLPSASAAEDTSARAVVDPPRASAEPVAPSPSGSASAEAVKRPRVAATPIFTPAPPPPPTPGTRQVQFNVNPKGARLALDGTPIKSWLTAVTLPVGAHHVDVTPIVEQCCKKLSKTVMVEAPPAGAPDTVQQIQLTMEIRPATVSLANGPQNGQLFCSGIGLTSFMGSGAKEVTLREPEWQGTCMFSAPDKPSRSGRVTIRAGAVNTIPWAGD